MVACFTKRFKSTRPAFISTLTHAARASPLKGMALYASSLIMLSNCIVVPAKSIGAEKIWPLNAVRALCICVCASVQLRLFVCVCACACSCACCMSLFVSNCMNACDTQKNLQFVHCFMHKVSSRLVGLLVLLANAEHCKASPVRACNCLLHPRDLLVVYPRLHIPNPIVVRERSRRLDSLLHAEHAAPAYGHPTLWTELATMMASMLACTASPLRVTHPILLQYLLLICYTHLRRDSCENWNPTSPANQCSLDSPHHVLAQCQENAGEVGRTYHFLYSLKPKFFFNESGGKLNNHFPLTVSIGERILPVSTCVPPQTKHKYACVRSSL